MQRRIGMVAAAMLIGLGLAIAGQTAGAQVPPGCAPGDLGCELVRGLEEAFTPTTATSPGTSASTPGSSTSAPVGDVAAAGAGATQAELAAGAGQIPSLPAAQALELPPLTIPDFGADAPGVSGPPLARPVRPLRAELADVLPGRPGPSDGQGAPVGPLALAVGLPAVLVALSAGGRRLARRRATATTTAVP